MNKISELSERLRRAISFLKDNGYAKNDTEIARTIGVTSAALCMATNGQRTPTWRMLLDFCDHYPINFWWLRSGEGSMVKLEREQSLLVRIEELERRISELEKD